MPTLTCVLAALLLGASDAIPPSAPAAPPPVVEADGLRQFLTLRRVFVDRFSGGETAAQMRDMIINGLESSKLFVITENEQRADAILRGSSEDLVYNEPHSSSDSVNFHDSMNSSQSEEDTALRGGTRTYDRSSKGTSSGGGASESSRSAGRLHEASAAVRLVGKNGDVIWSTTQESMGGKFRGASSDVADKITKRLVEDYERAKKLLAR